MKIKTKLEKLENKPRNLLHDHPLLQKGGVHEKSNKQQRKKLKQNLLKDLD